MGRLRGEVVAGVVENAAHGRVGAAHHALHAVDGAEEVRAMNSDGATGADEDVLVVVGHADDLVGNDLADGEDEVVAAVAEELVDLCGPGVVDLSFGDLVEEGARNLAQGDDIVAPVVDAEEISRRLAVHGRDLGIGHALVGSERRKDVGQAVAVVLPGELGENAGLRVKASEIRGNGEDSLSAADGIQCGEESSAKIVRRHLGGRTSGGEIKTHESSSYAAERTW